MQRERYGTRDLSCSAWLRAASIRRFIGWERALLSMCDADSIMWLEYRPRTKEPLGIDQGAVDVGQDHKAATAIARLARRARLPAYLELYQRATTFNPADPQWRDLCGFRAVVRWKPITRSDGTIHPLWRGTRSRALAGITFRRNRPWAGLRWMPPRCLAGKKGTPVDAASVWQ